MHSYGTPTDQFRAAAFSPDGRRIATEDTADGVRVWDVDTGKLLSDHKGFNPFGVQGVYLKGQGIVCTVTLPTNIHQKIVGGPDTPAAKTLSEWERIRKELRGEKTEADKPKESSEASLADAILKVLADNGKNLTHLSDNESVTVAVTLGRFGSGRPGGMMGGGMPGMMPPGGRGGMGGGAMMPGGPGGMAPGGGTGAPPGGDAFNPGGGQPPGGNTPPGTGSGGGPRPGGSGLGGAPGPDNAGEREAFRKSALLGDLALKQQDYANAVTNYRQTIAATRNLRHDAETELEIVEVASKCARALIAQGKTDEAEAMVKGIGRITDHMGGASAGGGTKPVEPKAEMPLPDKLIVSVPKKLLEAYATGSLSFDAFRKGASVEHLTFAKPAGEQPKGGASRP